MHSNLCTALGPARSILQITMWLLVDLMASCMLQARLSAIQEGFQVAGRGLSIYADPHAICRQ